MDSLPFFSHMLDPQVDRKFSLLCEDVDCDMITALVADVEQHVFQVRRALEINEFLDVEIAERIARILKRLLGEIDRYPLNKKKLIIGAARYFVKNNDAQSDLGSLLGFDDDVAVLNYVLVELSLGELRLSL